MSWDIKVWHEETQNGARLCIEASLDVPDEVVATVAGSYWLEEVQYDEADWGDEADVDSPGGNPPRLQG